MVLARISLTAPFLRRLSRNTRGGVALIGALSLTTLIGMGAFAVEATRGYAADANNQRVADMAALAGALAYNVNSSTGQMTATAKAVVAAQGLPASAATVALVTDAATSKQLVQVTVTTSVPIALGRVFTSALSYDVTAVGAASTSTTATTQPPCIATLSNTPTYGITLSGGVSINSPGCAINTNSGVTVPWGTYITAKQVNAGKAVNNPGSGITTTPTANDIVQNKTNAAADWMKDDTSLKTVLCKVNKLSGASDADYADGNTVCTTPAVAAAAVSGAAVDWDLNYSPSGPVLPAWKSGSTYTIPAAASREIRTLNIAGGITAVFQGPSNLTITTVNMGGTSLSLGNGNVNIGSISITGGATVVIDVGVGNTVSIGANISPTGPATTVINLGGGSKFCFTPLNGSNCGTPTAAAGTFSINGTITTAGGSKMSFPKAATHVINGNINSSGAMTFGAGTYYVNGNFVNNTGDPMIGTDVTFGLAGTLNLSGGTSIDLSAPGALSSYGVPGLLFATKTTAATSIGGGATGKYAGLIYAPKSDFTVSGGASLSASGSNCLMMILNTLTLAGGTNVASACSGLSGVSGTTPNVALFR